jgi:hypothetical protein
MQRTAIDKLPGFRRRFIVTPALQSVHGEVEDDYHCMGVTIHHDGKVATAIEPLMMRAPWTTCPGAVAVLQQTFTGVALQAFADRGEKRANCTHLHDLAVLAAAHAFDGERLIFDILVSDPIEDRRQAELRRNGRSVLSWVHANGQLIEPAELAGVSLDKMRPWIDSLDPERQEAARLLRWGTMVANGRTIPMERQSDASRMRAGSCYTFQLHRMRHAKRIGVIRDFSDGTAHLLERQPAAKLEDTAGRRHI